jgi:hypothetical protein
VLDELIGIGAFTQEEVLDAAHQILHGNAEKLYELKL